MEALCGSKAEGIPDYPALAKGYVRKIYAKELKRLERELFEVNPNIIIALGNTAMWALLGRTMISKLRGVVQYSTHTITDFKILPTYHPAAIFRQWSLRPITILDLMKAKRESEYPDIRRPSRSIWINPTLEDIREFDILYIQNAERLAVDIETAGSTITCIGFAPKSDLSIVIPFAPPGGTGGTYWTDTFTYKQVYLIVRSILSRPTPKIFQNGLYDIAFLRRAYGIRVRGAEHDTMLLHHALQPESLKGLGFLGSVYTDEGAWKQLKGTRTTIKRDD